MSKKLDVEAAMDPGFDLLLQAASGAGQKARVTALAAEARSMLVDAVQIVSERKLQAYLNARAGAPGDLHGWIQADHQLARATALLSGYLIPVSAVAAAQSPARAAGASQGAAEAPKLAGADAEAAADQGQADFGF